MLRCDDGCGGSAEMPPMSLLSLIAVLLIEQVRPLNAQRWVHGPLARIATWVESRFNAGEVRHGALAWCLLTGVLVLVGGGGFWQLASVNPVLGWGWNVLILYLTMGFRQESHYFTDIHLALRMGEVERARTQLAEWRGRGAAQLSSSEVARLAIEEGLVAAHRNVFAVLFWFVILPGPSGAILYRVAEQLPRVWREDEAFGRFAARAFMVLDWLPQRITATCFAIVGDFEDAVYCWRTQAAQWGTHGAGIILASGAGALGVRLGMPLAESDGLTERPDLGLGDEADVDFMQSTVGLVWRALVLWLLALLLLGIASWMG